jgi:hypothetical protein
VEPAIGMVRASKPRRRVESEVPPLTEEEQHVVHH